jgi:regulator of protease activity HflC (stomatin/prohibitin superfamily)
VGCQSHYRGSQECRLATGDTAGHRASSGSEEERRAKVIHAEGEFEASQDLADAADVIDRNPVALQLRYLQTLVEISADKNSTTIFPIPIDTIAPFLKWLTQK